MPDSQGSYSEPFCGLKLFQSIQAGFRIDCEDIVGFAIAGAQVVEFIDVVPDTTHAKKSIEYQCTAHVSDCQTVWSSPRVDVVACQPASATGHVLDQNSWIARNVFG